MATPVTATIITMYVSLPTCLAMSQLIPASASTPALHKRAVQSSVTCPRTSGYEWWPEFKSRPAHAKPETTCEKFKNFRQLQQSIAPSVCAFKHEYLCGCTGGLPMGPSLAGSSGDATEYPLVWLLGMALALEPRYESVFAMTELFLHLQNKIHWCIFLKWYWICIANVLFIILYLHF